MWLSAVLLEIVRPAAICLVEFAVRAQPQHLEHAR
jgi:hypothetical protein